MGAMRSTLAMMTPNSEKKAVSSRARSGSPLFVVAANTFIKGMTPSDEMACSSRGAPASKGLYLFKEICIIYDFFFCSKVSS